MSPKNLNAQNKTHKFLLNYLKDPKILEEYKKFEKNLRLNEDFIVAVSGGPDSLALSFLTKIYSIKKNVDVKYFIVDHKLRNNSTKEAKFVKNLFKKLYSNLTVLTWFGKKPKSNIQSIARNKRYELLVNKAKKLNISNILLGHHKDDLIENFFIRILRGSGLNGITSFDKKTNFHNINLIRPLLIFSKKDLVKITEKVFKTYVQDPSNKKNEFKRVKIRNFIKNLELEGLDKDKFDLTIKNLKFSNQSIKYFVEKNLKDNSTIIDRNKFIILNKDFFYQPEEVVFRSLSEVIKIVGKKHYPARGKKLDKLINHIKNNLLFKTTLGNCILKKVNNTIMISKEH
ncbi:tRNA lysidine(34) synthetase TilS [Candidatus Pelagibacter sp.]|nr:tRNA lysidine(34) synthetase TilS [Candidatus Pelagibacter sp.]